MRTFVRAQDAPHGGCQQSALSIAACAGVQAEEGPPQLALTGEEDEDLESQMDAALRGSELQVYARVRVPARVWWMRNTACLPQCERALGFC